MIRLFETHNIRKQVMLSEKIWNFRVEEEHKQEVIKKVVVPCCIEKIPGFENYRGWSTFETEFESEGICRLEFKGVSHYAEIYVDGEKVKSHYGSYTPFEVILPKLQAGYHTLKVLVDNAFREQYSVNIPNDYMSYGGITRGVVLETIQEQYINYVHFVTVQEDNKWKVSTEISCQNQNRNSAEVSFSLQIGEHHIQTGNYTLQYGENILKTEDLYISDVQSWSIEHPVLYMAKVQMYKHGMAIDDQIERIGFRMIQIRENQVLLNGRAITIKGFCRHEDHPQYGCAIPLEAMAYDLALMKDLGANSVRTSHYPNDELFLDLCDELGILIWEENHARGLDEKQMLNPNFEEQCEQCIREMIQAHYNHPSIYAWGILNECVSDTIYGRGCYQAQCDLIRSLDRSRIISYASCKFNTDICQDIPDICSWNIYPYWYKQETANQMIDGIKDYLKHMNIPKEKPFLVTEIGAGAIYGFRSPEHDIWSEENQADILDKQIHEVMNRKDCIGLYLWQFCDIRVSRELWGMRRPKNRNNKGIVDEYRRPKLAYQNVKNLFIQISNYREIE